MSLKILLLDIETAPNTAYVWGLFRENIPLARLIDTSRTMCWSAKWFGKDEVMFSSIQETSPRRMLAKIHRLLDQADAVVHYNGTRYDIPILNKEFLVHGFTPPSPVKHIDLLKVARNQFKFTSNKLDFVAKYLGLGAKTKNTDFQLWVKCMAKDPEAWKLMKEYNINDVVLLERVYKRMLPWIKKHPNYGLYEKGLVCPNCGGDHYQRRGFTYTDGYKYSRYQCQAEGCGKWFRGNKTETKKDEERFIGI
jgi:DNA polymerase elongation subunit (family B)